MTLWTTEALRLATGATPARPIAADGVSIDTRTLRPGDLFVALVSESGDGHEHVAAALARGAAGALVHRPVEGLPADAKLLRVADTLEGLWALGAYGRDRFGGRVVAITGSVGKTSTKEMLRGILSAQGATHAAEASYNNHWGVPLTLARLPPEAAYCVVEIGMNHPGEIAPLARLARPHVAVITTIATAHIGHMGSIEAIADEKATILWGLEQGGVGVIPEAPLRLRQALPPGARLVTFGCGAEADAQLTAAIGGIEGSDVGAKLFGRDLRFHLAAPGRHMAMNAVAALAATQALGADPVLGARALADFQAVGGRGARRPILGGQAMLLDESYNASPLAVRAALALLRLAQGKRRIAVLGDMLELGEHAPSEHAGLAPDVEASADLLFACGPQMRHLYAAVPPAHRGAYAADSDALAAIVARTVAPGDAVLVKGSLGSRMKRVVEALEQRSA